MGRNKSQREKRDKKITVVYCRENRIYDIVDVLRYHNFSHLWDKPKPEWHLVDWNEYFLLKSQYEQIKNCIK